MLKKLIAAFLLAGLLWLAVSGLLPSAGWKTHDVTGHLPDLHFTLTEDHDAPVTQASYPDTLKLIYFGFTSCPDECPLMMGRLTGLLKTLGKNADYVHVFFITIDSNHDTALVLNHYLRAFDPAHMTGLTGDENATLAKAYRNVYRPGVIMHSDAVYIFDANNYARLIATSQDSDEAMLHDIQRLMHESHRN